MTKVIEINGEKKVVLFLVGFLILFILGALAKKLESVSSTPSIHAEPVREDHIFVDLDRMMDEHHLELRLRRVDGAWQITFTTHHNDGIIRIVGQGSATSILDALIKAEADFLERTG